ncbi:MAG TPA: RNA polymerase sigma factor [Candidatus Angelobacter sp.]|jgi:RNA polymerase sigma-70 factor (ECF subfamily)|nr:RNA polymerase sigma factor [Candidatus Angelobacter sp.]
MEGFAPAAQWKIEGDVTAPGKSMGEAADQELLRQLAKGNEGAFRTLYERYQGRIYRFALHMAGNAAIAEETTQEVFMLLIRNSKGYDPAKGTVAGYLFGMARNIARRSMSDFASEVALDDEDDRDEFALAGDLEILEDLSQADLLDTLRKAVLGLPQQYREAVVLCDLEELSYEQAAELLGCPAGTVASRLNRARSLLKKKLSHQKCVK